MVELFGLELISKAHSDIVGIIFGIIVTTASLIIIAAAFGYINLGQKSEELP